MAKSLFEVRHPFFRPFWRRAVATAAVLGWTAFELTRGAEIWAAIFGAAGVYLFWQWFVAFDPAEYEDRE